MYFDEKKTGPGFRFRITSCIEDTSSRDGFKSTSDYLEDGFFKTHQFCLYAAVKLRAKGKCVSIWTNFPELDSENNKFFREWISYNGNRFNETKYIATIPVKVIHSPLISRLRFPKVPTTF